MSILIWIPTFKRHSDGIPDYFSANVDFEKTQQTTKRCGGGGGGQRVYMRFLHFQIFNFVNSEIFPRFLFSRTLAYAKFCENITLAKG